MILYASITVIVIFSIIRMCRAPKGARADTLVVPIVTLPILFLFLLVVLVALPGHTLKEVRSFNVSNVRTDSSSTQSGAFIPKYVYSYKTVDGGIMMGWVDASEATINVDPSLRSDSVEVWKLYKSSRWLMPFDCPYGDRYVLNVSEIPRP